MKKRVLSIIGIISALGVGAFALNAVGPAAAGSLSSEAVTRAEPTASTCANRPTAKGVLDGLVQNGTITQDQENAIIQALKDARSAAKANRPNAGDEGAGPRAGGRRHPALRALEGAVQVAADKIGVSVDDLQAAVAGGQTIADVATAHNVAPADVEQAIVDAGTAKIDAAVTAGTLTDQQASFLKARLPEMANRVVNHVKPTC